GELGLGDCLQGEPTRTVQMSFPGGMGRWGMRRSSFRQGGLPHQLLVLADLSQALREEERQAWQRLLRVLGHELNNSLAPIKSIVGSLADGDQLEQMIINLLRNAAEVSFVTKGNGKIGWARTAVQLQIWVDDECAGLSNTANLFVPFFTTKPGGSGIGLVLSRQIA